MYLPDYDTGDDAMAPDNRGKVMGEMADYYIDQWADEGGFVGSYSRKKAIKCMHCNSKDVYWKQYPSGKWFLFDKKTCIPHKCKENSPAVSEQRKKELAGWKMIKCCNNCGSYDQSGRCVKHGFSTGATCYCKMWYKDE